MPSGFHIASAWVDIRAEDQGLRAQVRTSVLQAARGQEINVPIRVDSRGLRRDITEAVRAASSGQGGIKIPLSVETRGLRRELNRAIRVASLGKGFKLPVHVDGRGLRRELKRAMRVASAGQSIEVPLSIDSGRLRGELRRALRRASRGQEVEVDVRLNTTSLRSQISRIRIMTSGLRRGVNIPVRADTRQAVAGLNNVSRSAGVASNMIRRLGVIATGIGAIAPASIGAIAYALSQVGAAAAAAIPAVLALGSAAATIAVGASGVGDALKAAFAPVPKSAGAATAGTQKLVNAQRKLGDTGRAVAAAQRRVADASRAVKDAQRGVADATREAAEANRQAARDVAAAERALSAAQRQARFAQEDLTDARREAKRELRDMQASLATARLDERDAILSVKESLRDLKEARQDAQASPLDIARAKLRYDRAVQNLKDQRRENRLLKQDVRAATRAGVEGSEQVVNAKRAVRDAQRGVRDAERALAESERQQMITRREGQRQIAAANRQVADAQRALREAQRGVAEAQRNAAQAVADFGRAAGGAGGATNKFAQAMAKLSPNARKFVMAIKRLAPAWKSMQLSVQNKLFKDFGRTVTKLGRAAIPVLRRGLGGMATILNRMGIFAMQTVTRLARMGQLDAMFMGLNRAMKPLVKVPGQFLNSLVKLSIAAAPLLTRMTKAFGRWSTRMNRKITKAFNSGRLHLAIKRAGDKIVNFFRRIANSPEWKKFVSNMKKNGPALARALVPISRAILKIINAMQPLVGVAIKVATALAKIVNALPPELITTIIALTWGIKKLVGTAMGIARLASAFMTLRAVMGGTAAQSGAMALLGGRLGRLGRRAGGLRSVGRALRGVGAAGLALTATFFVFKGIDSLFDKAFGEYQRANVKKLAGSFRRFARTGKLTGQALKTVGKDFSAIGDAIRQVAHPSNLERVTHFFSALDPGDTKWDELKQQLTDTDKALAKMVASGNAGAARMVFQKLAREAKQGGTSVKKLKTLLPKYTKALKDQKLAQKLAAQAMGAYGSKAQRVTARLKENKMAVKGVKGSLMALNGATRTAMGAEINLESAIDQASAAARRNGATLDINTRAGQENKRALLALASATDMAVQKKMEETGSWREANKIYKRGKQQLIKVAMQMGLTKKEAEKLAGEILRIPDKKFTVKMQDRKALRQLRNLADKIRKTPNKKTITMRTLSRVAEKKLKDLGFKVKRMPDGRVKVTAKTKHAKKMLGKIEGIKLGGKRVYVRVMDNTAKEQLRTFVRKVKRAPNSKSIKMNVLDGAAKKALRRLGFKIKKTPDGKFKVIAKTGKARDKLGGVRKAIGKIKDKTVHINVFTHKIEKATKRRTQARARAFRRADGGIIPRFAEGGSPARSVIKGPGTKTSDSVMARLSRGEFVMRAKAVDMYGVDFMNAINSAKMPEFATGGSVGGGKSKARAVQPTVTQTQGGGAKAVLTATDATGPALLSAQKRFMQFKRIVNVAYMGINRSTLKFGLQHRMHMSKLMLTQKLGWTRSMRGMKLQTNKTYMAMNRATMRFGMGTTRQFTNTRIRLQRTWGVWGRQFGRSTQMTLLRNQRLTTRWGQNTERRFGHTKNSNIRTWKNWGRGVGRESTRTYAKTGKLTRRWGQNTEKRFGHTKNSNLKTWKNWGSGLKKTSNRTYGNITKDTKNWGGKTSREFGQTKNSTIRTWNNWKSGITRNTNKTYGRLKRATKDWKNDTVKTFKSAKNAVGNAWKGVKPKLAAPIKYLINKVINKGVVPAMNKVVKQLGGSAKLKKVSAKGFASGGYVSGPGSETSDSIPARLSDGEYVMKAKAVKKYGVGVMNRINSGRAATTAPVQHFATGGPVGGLPQGFAAGGMAVINKAGKSKLEKMLGDYEHKDFEKLAEWIFDNAVWPLLEQAPGGSAMKTLNKNAVKLMYQQAPAWLEANVPYPMGGANIQKAKKWARSQAGKPYQWGGAGNPSWDCSGFMGGIQKVIQGRNPKGRLYTTFAFSGNQAPAGWKRHLKSPFEVGVTNRGKGHMAGTLGGMNVESAGGVGVRVGKKARGAHDPMFGSNWYGFKPAISALSNYKPGKGVKQWTGVVRQALRETHQSQRHTKRVLMQMDSESNGNPRAVNRTDINWQRGHPSVGLMQVIRPTFNAHAGKYRKRGPKMYGVSIDPLANIYSAIRYVLATYGSIPRGMRGHAYSTGGFVSGRGSGTSDSIHARLSDGEYVMSAAAVKRTGVGFMNSVNNGRIRGYASGGMVRDKNGKLVHTDYVDKVGDGIHTVRRGDTLSELALKWGSSVEELVRWNRISNKDLIYVGEQLRVLNNQTFRYQIKRGDTLSEIAAANGTTVAELMRLNDYIKDKDLIYAGKWLTIPGDGPGGGGSMPPQFNPPYSFPELRKYKKGEVQDEAALKSLENFVTLSDLSKEAGFKDSELIEAFTNAENLEALTANFWDVRKRVDAALMKDIRDKLIKRIDLAGEHLIDWQKKLDENTASMTAANQKLEEVQQQFDNLKSSIASTVMEFGGIAKVAKFGTSVQTVINQLQSDVSKSKEFGSLITQLRAKGLNSDMIGQIAQAGIMEGSSAAKALLTATPEQIAELNRLQEELVSTSTSVGEAAAQGMYGAGLEAAQGVVDGLLAKQDEIKDAMRQIAEAIEKSIRDALGISSPSRVMMEMAQFVPLGFAKGILDNTGEVKAAVMAMCAVPDREMKKPAVGSGGANNGTMSSGHAGCGIVINGDMVINVDANVEIDKPNAARQFAKELAPAMKEELRKYDKERRK